MKIGLKLLVDLSIGFRVSSFEVKVEVEVEVKVEVEVEVKVEVKVEVEVEVEVFGAIIYSKYL